MKTAIITLYGLYNYGNRLQNYALQEFIKTIPCDVETLVYEWNINNTDKPINYFHHIKKLLSNIIYFRRNLCLTKRDYKFLCFNQKFIHESPMILRDEEDTQNLKNQYDFFIVGSDQVWNPHFIKDSTLFFLPFAYPQQRIAFSASFGIHTIPHTLQETYRKYLSGFASISVREESGADIIKHLLNKDVLVLPDPTLLLSSEQWKEIAIVPSLPKESYLFMYFLDPPNAETLKWIKQTAASNHLKIANINDYHNEKTFISSPDEFLGYIMAAGLICTDSFHGTVFSILFKRPFIVFKRNDKIGMYSRIETLLKKFSLQNRQKDLLKNSDLFKCDFSHIDEVLQKEKIAAVNYLAEILLKSGKEQL